MINSTVASNGNFTFYVSLATNTLYPTQCTAVTPTTCDNDNITVVTSNTSAMLTSPLTVPTHALATANITLQTTNAIVDSGATQIFVMENMPVVNRRITCSPLKVALANGREVFS
jgi:hypothetical protein